MLVPTTKRKFNSMVIFAYAMVYVVWGSTYFFIHKALSGFEPFMLGAIRFTIAGLMMLTWCHYKGHKIFNWNTAKNASVTGLLLLFVDTGIIIWVEQFLASGLVSIMAASAAIWFVVLDKPKWGENFRSLPILAGLFLGFMGVVMLFGDQLAMAQNDAERKSNLGGMLLLVAGAIAWTAGSLYSKYCQNKEENKASGDQNSMVGTAWQLVIAGGAFIVTALFRGEFTTFNVTAVPAEAWWSMIYLIVFGSLVAYSSYIWLLKVRPATEVSTYAYVNPIVAVILSYFLTDETITSVQITGLAIILLSVFLMNWDAYMKSDNSGSKISKRAIRTKPKYRLKKRRRYSKPSLNS